MSDPSSPCSSSKPEKLKRFRRSFDFKFSLRKPPALPFGEQATKVPSKKWSRLACKVAIALNSLQIVLMMAVVAKKSMAFASCVVIYVACWFSIVFLYKYNYYSVDGLDFGDKDELMRLQRGIVRKAWAFFKLDDSVIDSWQAHEGWKFANIPAALSAASIGFSFIRMGSFSSGLVAFSASFHMAMAFRSRDRATIEWASRFNALTQVCLLFLLADELPPHICRRAVIMRTISCFGVFERLSDMAVELGLLYMLFLFQGEANSTILTLPWKVFLAGILPAELLGFRALFAETVYRIVSDSTMLRNVLVTSFIPLATITFSYSATRLEPSTIPWSYLSDERAVFIWAGVVFAMGGIVLVFKADRFDSFMTELLGFQNSSSYVLTTMKRSGDLYETLSISAVSCCLVLCFGQPYNRLAISLPLTILFVLWRAVPHIFVDHLHPQDQNDDSSWISILARPRLQRGSVVFFHGALLTLALFGLPSNQANGFEWKSWFVAFSYVLYSFDDLPSSVIIRENLLCASVQMFVAPFTSLPVILLLSMFNIAIAFVLRLSREQSYRLIDSMRAADSFIDHAVKQKFSAIGAALENVTKNERNDLFEESTKDLLASAVNECRIGHDACYLSSVLMQLDTGIIPFSTDMHSLSPLIKEWVRKSAFCEVIVDGNNFFVEPDTKSTITTVAAEDDEPILGGDVAIFAVRKDEPVLESTNAEPEFFVKINADILRALLNDILRRSGMLKVVVRPSQGVLDFVCLTAHAISERSEIRSRCVSILGGLLIDGGKTIRLPVMTRDQAEGSTESSYIDTHMPYAGIASASEISPEIPEAKLTSPSISPPTKSSLLLDEVRAKFSPKLPLRRLSPGVPPLGSRLRRLSMRSSITADAESAAPNTALASEVIHFFPKELSVAVLDDNSLVRMSIQRTLTAFLKKMPEVTKLKSYIRGATAEESKQFPMDIINWKCDIALFDQNLDYEDDDAAEVATLQGTKLALEAKNAGYKGCLILHSANRSYHDMLPDTFDGFIEKTSDHEQFCDAFLDAWTRFCERKEEWATVQDE